MLSKAAQYVTEPFLQCIFVTFGQVRDQERERPVVGCGALLRRRALAHASGAGKQHLGSRKVRP